MQKNKGKYIKIISAEKYENQVIAINTTKVAATIVEKKEARIETFYSYIYTFNIKPL